MITDGYDRCRQRKLPSMPSHERKLYHPDEFRQWPTPRYTGYRNGWSEKYGFSSEVEIWRTGSLLDVFLFLSSLLLIFGSRPSINGVGTGFTTSGSQSMGGGVSPCARPAERSPWSRTDRLWDLWVRTSTYVAWLFLCFHYFPFLLVYGIMQARRSATKEGDNVTARLHVTCPGPGNSHFI